MASLDSQYIPGYDIVLHRNLTGCEHALHETCHNCMCACCGGPIVKMKFDQPEARWFAIPFATAARLFREANR